MERALVLTEEKAQEAGYAGAGPFTFAGAFPGVWIIGQPLEVSTLGFDDEEQAMAALEDAGIPLETVEVAAGSAPPFVENHALSDNEVREQSVEEVRTIRTHAEADAAAAELGITFATDPKPKLEEKIAALEQARGATVATGTPDEITPAPGAEDSVPELEGLDETETTP